MPGVVNATEDQPAKLERVEVEPGVVLKLTAKEAEAYRGRLATEAEERAAYQRLISGKGPGAATAASEPAAVPLTVLTKAELVSLAEARGLATSGSKAVIAARFAEDAGTDDASDEDSEAEASDESDATGEA